jgi:tetratricopeptide (TPR) repeat protein
MEKNNITGMTKSSDQSFEKLYLEKDYKGAVDYLLKNKQLFNSGIFHYNLGTTYAKLGELSTARYHFEKSIQEGYVNSSSLNNLNYIKIKLGVDDITTSTALADQTMNIVTSLPIQVYSLMTLSLLLFAVILLKLNQLQSKIKMISVFAIVPIPVVFYSLYVFHLHPAIAFKEIPLLEGPSKIFPEKGKVKAGSKIIVSDYKDGWYFVKNPESLVGWVSKDQLGQY